MNKFYIITNEHKDKNLSLTHSMINYIELRGGTCGYFVSTESNWNVAGLQGFPMEEIDAECIFVLGGDGTLVRAARDLADLKIPLVGVNMGTLGYLCELEKTTVFSAIDQLFRDDCVSEKRMLLEGFSETADEAAKPLNALNDIVIHRSGRCQMLNLVIAVNGEYLTTYNADGIILSTPTGSTGYSMAAGGPIVDPKAELIVITPINTHSLSAQSIIVEADATIQVSLSKRRTELDEEAEVSFDGDRFTEMRVGDRICVRKSRANAQILKLNQLSFLQILRKKMQD